MTIVINAVGSDMKTRTSSGIVAAVMLAVLVMVVRLRNGANAVARKLAGERQ
jgi:hypothetical protein